MSTPRPLTFDPASEPPITKREGESPHPPQDGIETESQLATRRTPEIEIYPFRIDQIANEQLYSMWRKVDAMPYFLDDTLRDPFTFGSVLASPSSRCAFIGPLRSGGPPSGILYAYAVVPKQSAGLAIAIWDRAAWGRTDLVRIGIQALARDERLNLHRLWATVAEPNRPAHRLMRRLGWFEKEAELREALCYDGVWTDVAVYAALCEEIRKK